MRILQLGKFYPIRGGVEKVMADITEGLAREGVACDMLCAASKGQKSGVLQAGGTGRIIIVPAIVKAAATMISPAMVLYLRRHRDYDLIHIHHPDPMAAAALFFSGYKGPVVLHWHSDIIKQKFLKRLYLPLQKWLLRRACAIVGTSVKYLEESPDLEGFRDKAVCIPIGVDPIRATPSGIKDGVRHIIALGRFVGYKGYEHLLRAAALLPDGYRLTIAGEGPLLPQMKQLCAGLGIEDKVSLPGRISDSERELLLADCDLFVLSSIHKTEAFAIVQIEAMSCGKPVVSTDIPGSGVSWVNADGESGIVVPPADAEALAGAVRRICEDPELYSRLSEGARGRYRKYFTKEKMIRSCLELYQGIL